MSLVSGVCVALAAVACAQPVTVTVDTSAVVSRITDTFAPTFGWEMWAMFDNYMLHNHLTDSRYITAASALAPALVRVGGITADWIYYDLTNTSVQPSPSPGHRLGGFWPTAEQNFTMAQFKQLLTFFNATGLRLLFDLNELHGRNCQTVNPITNGSDWCVGEWDTSNVRDFLQAVHDQGLYGPGSPLYGFELGNELISHLPAENNTQDIILLSGIIKSIWSDGTPPPFFAPSTDACYTTDTRDIMRNVTGAVTGFTFHAYPGGSGTNPTLQQLLLNSTWLRTGIMDGSLASQCIGWWNNNTRASGMQLWVTESSSSWNLPLPAPAQNSFLNGFFTIPELGQYAVTGVSAVARWSFSEPSPFGTIILNDTAAQWDAAADYFLLLAYKNLVGSGVLAVSGDDASDALVYAHCGQVANGSVVLLAVNPSQAAISISLQDASGSPISSTPRTEWIFTAPAGNLSSTTPVLNDNDAAPLRLGADGSAPALPGNAIPVGGATLTLPPLSQAFVVLPAAAAVACS